MGELPPRVGVVQRELDRFDHPRYLEIGVFDGKTFLNVNAGSKIAVDPRIRITGVRRRIHSARTGALFVESGSDEFFAGLEEGAEFDVVFVDGLHLYEQALRDTQNALNHLVDEGVVLMHDCSPPAEAVAARNPAVARGAGHQAWCGDVWKAVVHLRATRSDLHVSVLDTDYGIGVVRRGDSETLALDPADIEGLTYADLEAERRTLLGLTTA